MSVKFFCCGDIVNKIAKNNFVDDRLKEIISSSDIAICNFEAPIYTSNMRPIKKAGPHLFQSAESAEYLKNSGFTHVSIANNHIYDYGNIALENTINTLKKNKIDYVGGGMNFNDAYQAKIITNDNIKIGILSACENEFGCLYENQNRGGYAWLFHPLIEDSIRSLKSKVDFVVLMAHAGVENIDFPIKEWRDKYQRFCDIGVDVVVGHHPHVPQGYEKYNNGLIFYSLGNFYFDTKSFSDKSDDSYSVVLKFTKGLDVSFDIICHKKIDGTTCMVNKEQVNFSLDRLNTLLEKQYNERNDKLCIDLFNKYYYSYYEVALGTPSEDANIMQLVKFIVKRLFLRKRNIDNKNLMLLHNIRIDSHRFVVQRALSLIS